MNLPPSQVKYYPAPPAPKHNTTWWIIGGAVVLITACCVVGLVIGGFYYFNYSVGQTSLTDLIQTNPTPSPDLSTEQVYPTEQIETIPPLTTDEPVELPTTTVTPTLEPTPNVNANGISFSFTPAIAQNINAETIAAVTSTQNEGFPGEVYPQHTKFTFSGYPLRGTFHTPHILIYPAKEYADMDPTVLQIINDLKQFLAEKPSNPERIPFLPRWNAGQMFRSNIEFLSFKNGNGVRFLTMYGQAYYPVNNNSLFYTFQGLTNDGAYYIAAILPVSHPSLPANENEIPGGNFDAFVANIEKYWMDTKAQLEAQPANSFSPDLALLDAMFESFAVNP